jgi:hypothetical protein
MTEPADAPRTPLESIFLGQARACRNLGSPFSATVLEVMLADLQAGGVFADVMAPFAEFDLQGQIDAATPIRPLGWAHDLALSGEAPVLTAIYPPNVTDADPDALAAVLIPLARAGQAELAAFIASPPQTNEVQRTLALLGGFTTVAAETGLPLRCLEIGASAGLNLNWPLYHYGLGDVGRWGNPDSPVRIEGPWRGPPPPLAPVVVVERRGCDIAPVDIRDPGRARRLRAYVWADQRARVVRIDAAIALARESGLDLVAADAADWVEANVHPVPGTATVLYHSVMWQYLPAAIQARIEAHMAAIAEQATPDAPLAWLSMEMVSGDALMAVTLRVWPNGGQRRLARVHPHGAFVEWSGGT